MAGYGSLEDLLMGSVEVKHNRNKAAFRAKIDRLSRKAPEVMVKVTGHTKGAGHMKSHLDYISRNGDVELETDTGEILRDKNAVKSLHSFWQMDAPKGQRDNARTTSSIVFSMPKGTDPQAVKASVREYAKKEFSNYKYVMALHEDTDSPHVHLTINNYGMNGKKLHIKKGDPQRWREGFAEALRSRGVEAEATSRAARGVIKKGISQVIKHIREKGINSEMDTARVRAIIGEFKAEREGKEPEPKPWESKIRERQAIIRGTWLGVAKELYSSNSPEDKALGARIVGFLKDMPPVKTQNQELKERMAAQMNGTKSSVKDQQKQNERDDYER